MSEEFMLNLAAQIVAAEEAQARTVIVEREERKESKTKIVDKKDYEVERIYDIIDTQKPGKLREAMIKSSSSDFSITISLDGVVIMDRSFSDLKDISEYSESIDAFQSGSYYIVSLRNLSWRDSFRLRISTSGVLTFPWIFAVWDEEV